MLAHHDLDAITSDEIFKKITEADKENNKYLLKGLYQTASAKINRSSTLSKKEKINQILYYAILCNQPTSEFNEIKATEEIIQHDKLYSINDDQQGTLLHVATYYGRTKWVHRLFMNGANINIQNKHGETPLHIAIANKNYYMVGFLLRFEAINLYAKDNGGEPLDNILDSEDIKLITIIINWAVHNINFYARSIESDIYAIVNNQNEELIKLIKHIAKWAIKNRYIEIFGILLQASYSHLTHRKDLARIIRDTLKDTCITDKKDGNTLLHWAAMKGDVNIMQTSDVMVFEDGRIILTLWHYDDDDKDTRAKIKNAEGKRAIEVLAKNDNIKVIDTMANWFITRRLTKNVATLLSHIDKKEKITFSGNNINMPDYDKKTVLHWAIEMEYREVTVFLLNNGADPKLVDEDKKSPLNLIAAKGNRDEMQALIQWAIKKKDVTTITELLFQTREESQKTDLIVSTLKAENAIDIHDINEDTPLKLVVYNTAPEDQTSINVFVALLRAGADPTVENKHGRTALDNIAAILPRCPPIDYCSSVLNSLSTPALKQMLELKNAHSNIKILIRNWALFGADTDNIKAEEIKKYLKEKSNLKTEQTPLPSLSDNLSCLLNNNSKVGTTSSNSPNSGNKQLKLS